MVKKFELPDMSIMKPDFLMGNRYDDWHTEVTFKSLESGLVDSEVTKALVW